MVYNIIMTLALNMLRLTLSLIEALLRLFSRFLSFLANAVSNLNKDLKL